jgi:2-isopropylmalate synthase
VKIEFYDTTLRDGAQSEDIAFSLTDKLRITERLDDFGILHKGDGQAQP